MALATWWRGDPLPEPAPLPGLTVSVSDDVDLIASLASLATDEVEARLDAGHRAYLASINGTPAGYGWVATLSASIGELALAFDLPAEDRYLWDFATLPEWRGRGIYPRLLRAIVEVKLTSVDQLTYSEFVFSLENPTCFNIIQAEPLEGHLILDINPSILYLIIDRLLGGGRETAEMTRRPLTEIELRLVARVTDLFLREMKHSWEHIMEINARVDRVESNPQLVQIIPANEVIVLISFELTVGETRGMMNLCIPFNSIERISQKLSSNSWVSYSKRPATPESMQKIGNQLAAAPVEVVATLASTRITTAEGKPVALVIQTQMALSG